MDRQNEGRGKREGGGPRRKEDDPVGHER